MNYQRIYDQIIDRAKTRQVEGYVEKHHIIPKCLGGIDDIKNIVSLTAREHFICHQLLCEIHPNEPKLKYALYLMNIGKRKNKNADYKISSRTYERLKKDHSLLMMGNKNCINREQSQETRDKIGNANRRPKPKGFGTKPEGFGKKISKSWESRIHNWGNKISIKNKGLSRGKGIKKIKTGEKISKAIIQYDLQGNFVKEWKSGTEAALFLNKKSTSAICECCQNKRKTAYGYKWKYKI
jgi:hypothetical protein